MQQKSVYIVATMQMAETTTTPTEETTEGQEMSIEQDIQGEAEIEACMNPTPKSTQLKRPRVQEKPTAWKKTRTMKTPEGDLLDSGESVCNATKDALEELMMEQTTVLGALRAHLQELQV